jgi:putative transposase
LGIDLERGRPGHPQDNGAHERLHRDISLELQCLGRIDQNSLELWRQEFNEQRPHEALAMRCPSELYRHSACPYCGGVQQLDYPQMITRRVNHTGTINWASAQLFVSSSLAGWSVGLKPVEHQQLEVCFARLLLGWIDPKTASFRRADIVPKMQREAKTPKTNAGPWSRLAATRDLPTIAFSRADPLLRRNGPVPGILAADRPGGDYG